MEVFMYTTGFPSPARDFEERKLDLNSLLIKNLSSTFFMKAEVENSLDLTVSPGDILVVDRSIEPKEEDIIVSSCCEDLVLSTYKRTSVTERQNTHDDSIWGVVTWIIHRTK